MPPVAVKHITSVLIAIKVYSCSKRLPRSLSVTRSRRQQGLQQCGGKKATFILVVIAGGRPPNLHYLIFRYVSLGKYPRKIWRRSSIAFRNPPKFCTHSMRLMETRLSEVRRDKGAGRGPSSRCCSFPRCRWFKRGVMLFFSPVSHPPRGDRVDG